MKHNLQKKLKSYSSLAGALAATGAVNGQVVYTDVNPDNSFQYPFTYQLDLNQDGQVDFIIQPLVDNGGYSSANELVVKVQPDNLNINAVNADNNGAIAHATADQIDGNMSNWSVGGSGNNIGSAGVKMAFAGGYGGYYGGYYYGGYYGYGGQGGNWLGASDKYLALRFSTASGSTYYGWARLDVDVNAHSFTLKDYAYNATANGSIICEVPESTTGIENPISETKAISIYNTDRTIHVQLGEMSNAGTITVVDILGKEIRKVEINNAHMLIPVEEAKSGIYFVSVNNGSEQYTKKVVVK